MRLVLGQVYYFERLTEDQLRYHLLDFATHWQASATQGQASATHCQASAT